MTVYPVLGTDVSVWQDNNSTAQQVNFTKMKAAGASFVFIKASQGTWLDQDLIYNWSNAKAAGLLRGAYHYMTYDVSPITQAEYMWSVIKGDIGELPLVVDFENRVDGLTRSKASGALKAFIDRLQQLSGKIPMIYTSPGYWQEFGTSDAWWAKYPLWLAHYTATEPTIPLPWRFWYFWQYTSHGDGPKYGTESLNVDMDYFYGDLETLYALAGQTPPVTTWEQSIDAWARTMGYNGVRP